MARDSAGSAGERSCQTRASKQPRAAPVSGLWPWLALAGLGAFHGLNPAMGWLFAVALGLHRRSEAVVLGALALRLPGLRLAPARHL